MIVLKNERCSILVTNIFNLDYKYLLEEFGEEKIKKRMKRSIVI